MARILVMIAAIIVVALVAWMLFHLLIIGFLVLVVCTLAFGMFRVGRWTRRGSRQ